MNAVRRTAAVAAVALLACALAGCHYYKTGTARLNADGSVVINFGFGIGPPCSEPAEWRGLEPFEVEIMCDQAASELGNCTRRRDGSRRGSFGIIRTDTGKVDEEGEPIYEYDFDAFCDTRRVPKHD